MSAQGIHFPAGPLKTPMIVVVAAFPHPDFHHYTVNGEEDDVEIERAMEFVRGFGLGSVWIRSGEYNLKRDVVAEDFNLLLHPQGGLLLQYVPPAAEEEPAQPEG